MDELIDFEAPTITDHGSIADHTFVQASERRQRRRQRRRERRQNRRQRRQERRERRMGEHPAGS